MMTLIELIPELRETECEIVDELMTLLRSGNVDEMVELNSSVHARELNKLQVLQPDQ